MALATYTLDTCVASKECALCLLKHLDTATPGKMARLGQVYGTILIVTLPSDPGGDSRTLHMIVHTREAGSKTGMMVEGPSDVVS